MFQENLDLFVTNQVCPCQRVPACVVSSSSTCIGGSPPKELCFCANSCTKTLGQVCHGPVFSKGTCSKELICKLHDYQDPFNSEGICIPGFPRALGEPCGVTYGQGTCDTGLTCQQPGVISIGKCVKVT
ncbi:unnamed protein product [Gordionus sp. m RMFG-2023]